MLRLVLRSVLTLLGSALVGSLAVFMLLRLMRGDPAAVMLGEHATPESVARLRDELGLDRPWIGQYVDWVTGIVRGDLGVSYFGGRDVFLSIRERFGITFTLAFGSLVLSWPVALALGTYAAIHDGKRRGTAVDVAAQLGIAVPTFWVGLLLVSFASVRMGWLPSGGYVPWTESPAAAIRSLTLPVLTMTLSLASGQVRYVRAVMISILNEDYIRTAMAKGRTLRGALVVHGLRNASIPLVTLGVLTLGGLMVGAVVIEVVFSLPGLGRMLVDAVGTREVIVVQSLVFVFLLLIFSFNSLMDISYGLLDPRIRDAQGRAGGR